MSYTTMPSFGFNTLMSGELSELVNIAEDIDEMDEQMSNIYAEFLGLLGNLEKVLKIEE